MQDGASSRSLDNIVAGQVGIIGLKLFDQPRGSSLLLRDCGKVPLVRDYSARHADKRVSRFLRIAKLDALYGLGIRILLLLNLLGRWLLFLEIIFARHVLPFLL